MGHHRIVTNPDDVSQLDYFELTDDSGDEVVGVVATERLGINGAITMRRPGDRPTPNLIWLPASEARIIEIGNIWRGRDGRAHPYAGEDVLRSLQHRCRRGF
jgi:hypothetical protein